MSDRESSDLVTVCDKCLRASCWQGISMCEDARAAGIVRMQRSYLLSLSIENPDYLGKDQGNLSRILRAVLRPVVE